MSKVGPWYPRVRWCPDKKEWACAEYSSLNLKIDIHKHYSKGWFVDTNNFRLYKFRDESCEPIYFSSFAELMKKMSLTSMLDIESYICNDGCILDDHG